MTNLERWNAFLDPIESPQLFIDWTFYVVIAAALQRRVCIGGYPHEDKIPHKVFGNVYVVFIAPPGIGKSVAGDHVKDLFKSFGGFEAAGQNEKRLISVAPSSMSLEQLYEFLDENHKSMPVPPVANNGQAGRIYISSPLAFFATKEFGTFLRQNTSDTVTFLTEGWECGDFDRQTKRCGKNFIRNMCMTLLGCATEEWVREASLNGLLKQGFAARTIFAYASKKRKLTPGLYKFTAEGLAEYDKIKRHVLALTKLYGKVELSAEAEEWLSDWYLHGGEAPNNNDKRLIDYYGRKKLHLTKTAMLVHFADSTEMTLIAEDFKTASKILVATEREMHKALLGSGVNPAYEVAELIKSYLTIHGRTTGNKLLLAVFDQCPNATSDFQAAMSFLCDTNQIKPINGGREYELATKS